MFLEKDEKPCIKNSSQNIFKHKLGRLDIENVQ